MPILPSAVHPILTTDKSNKGTQDCTRSNDLVQSYAYVADCFEETIHILVRPNMT